MIVVEAIDTHAAPFIDSVIGSRMTLREVRTALHDSSRLLLVLTTDAVLAWQHRREEEREYIPHSVVPFLGPRLRHHFPERWRDLSEEIGRQQERGLWGSDAQTFHRLIIDALTNGTLELEVERRLGSMTIGDLNRTKEVDAEELLNSGNELEVCSLFLATFFPRLPVADFERALLTLVKGLSEEVRTTEFVLTSEGMGSSSDVTKSRPLADAWRAQRVAILKRCKLGIFTASAHPDLGMAPNAPCVDFVLPYLHSDMHTSFLSTHFLTFLELARRVSSLGFIFDPCPEVSDKAVALLVDLEERIPGELSRVRLRELLEISLRDGSLRPEGFDGLYRLLRAMLQSFELRYTSDSIFRELLAAGVDAEVPRLATLLHGVAGFDSYSWIRRLLDEGGPEANARTYFYILGMLLRGGAGTEDLLSRIGAWLPTPGANPETRGSQSAQDALSLLLDAAQVLLFDGRPRMGVWPPKDPILATLVSSGSNLESLAVRWLLHPVGVRLLEPNLSSHLLHWTVRWRIPSALDPVSSLLTKDLQGYLEDRWEPTLDFAMRDAKLLGITSPWVLVFPAMVLADWAVQLLCSREPEPPADALQTFERILVEVLKVAGHFERRALVLFWSTLEESVVDVLLSIDEITPGTLTREALTSVRKDLQRRSWAIRQLRSRFSARVNAPRSPGESADACTNS